MKRVLMYHSIGTADNTEAGARVYAVAEQEFRKQAEYISGAPKTLSRPPLKQQDFPVIHNTKTQVVMTFDDGLADNYNTALPILNDFGLKAYFFILAGRIGTDGYMSWEQLKTLDKSGMVIGSHGMNHRFLTTLGKAEIEYELAISKKLIEDKLGAPVDFFSVPRGFYDKRVVSLARDSGYKAIFTSNPGDNDGYRIGRIAVKSDWNIKRFRAVVEHGLSVGARLEAAVKGCVAKTFGAKTYDKIRKKIIN